MADVDLAAATIMAEHKSHNAYPGGRCKVQGPTPVPVTEHCLIYRLAKALTDETARADEAESKADEAEDARTEWVHRSDWYKDQAQRAVDAQARAERALAAERDRVARVTRVCDWEMNHSGPTRAVERLCCALAGSDADLDRILLDHETEAGRG